MNIGYPLLNMVIALLAAPLMAGMINRVKAFFAGRKGPCLLQLYFDIVKLLRKGAVYSRTTGALFRLGPPVGLISIFTALLFVPCGAYPAVLFFPGDMVFFVYLLGTQRFFMILAALDTGSSFEGMGASRDAQFSVLSEAVLFLCLAVMAAASGSVSLNGMLFSAGGKIWQVSPPVLIVVVFVLYIVLLAENYRVPFDDPNTHLELTMIHEVMALDHGGADLAMINYASSLKFWALAALPAGLLFPYGLNPDFPGNALLFLGVIAATAVLTGVVESGMARLRLLKVPQLLTAAAALSLVALIFLAK
ncbi:MAG: NADH-quinone oxidoreductase subunit H [Candidatus Omnitrophota bacterium]|jgi:formate hydrogenlyase subunit 4